MTLPNNVMETRTYNTLFQPTQITAGNQLTLQYRYLRFAKTPSPPFFTVKRHRGKDLGRAFG